MTNLAACLDAVRKYAPDHPDVQASEYWTADHGNELWVYFNDPVRDAVGEGEIYYTFIVRTEKHSGKIIKVMHYRSKKGMHGDSTLPP